MKHATIISGAYDNSDCKEHAANVVDDNGNINWGAAFRADPGVRKCHGCSTYYWNEAKVMECPDCKSQFGDGTATPNG